MVGDRESVLVKSFNPEVKKLNTPYLSYRPVVTNKILLLLANNIALTLSLMLLPFYLYFLGFNLYLLLK